MFEPDRTDARGGVLNRHVDRCRLVHQWSAEEVWEIIARWRVNVHPAYHLQFGRVSCANCIFLGKHGWASVRAVVPEQFEQVAQYEKSFGKTIDRDMGVVTKANMGTVYSPCRNDKLVGVKNRNWNGPIILEENEWRLPAGAFGETNGPT